MSISSSRGRISRAHKLARLPRPVQHRRIPEPVHVLVHEARCRRLTRIESDERDKIDEAESDPPAFRPEIRFEQADERDRTGDLVAVREGEQTDMRSRLSGIAADEAAHAGIAVEPPREVGAGQSHRELREWAGDGVRRIAHGPSAREPTSGARAWLARSLPAGARCNHP